jgi:chromosome segregation ATPase
MIRRRNIVAKNETVQQQDIAELQSRLDWLDEERRKVARRLTELEQRTTAQDRELQSREQRIKELEQQLSRQAAQLARFPQVDTQLQQFRDEMVQLIEQYEKRRLQSEKEQERLHRVEQEVRVREIADIRKELPAIPKLQNDMELRKAEENRLANLIGVLQGKVNLVAKQAEDWTHSMTFLEESERQNNRYISELQANILEVNKRWEPIQTRLEVLGSTQARSESAINALVEALSEVKQGTQSWMEQIQLGEYERNQRLDNWRRQLDEQRDVMENYARQWVQYADQYKEAKMALQTLAEWQKQIEQQQRETSEAMRVESNRLRSLWDNFVTDNEKRWKTTDLDHEQRWQGSQRRERQFQEQLHELEEVLKQIEADKEVLWRIQTAQADAIKTLPRIWLEEVEKAISLNPNSRRQPALVPVREE